MGWIEILVRVLTCAIVIYSCGLVLAYMLIAIYSTRELREYLRKNSFTDYRLLAVSDQAPGISILAPAYNEGATIVENVRSLLSIYYNNLELIVINDGSKDDSLDKLIEAYDLYKADYFVNEQIVTKKIRGIYKSRNPVFHKLVVVDKENGGKADALNVGVNASNKDYIVCIDVDCILEQDALLKMMKPFMDSDGKRVIASGGVVRIANSCEIANGKLVKVNLPKKFLPRVQALEYIRAFLLGRMAWSRLNGLLLISGAFGAFDKEIVIKCGGYNHKTVGEDMELVVRMRRYMEEHRLPYRVTFIPDPLCWTEAPETYKILGRQRNRWTRGTMETLWFHRKMFFNPKYGILGMLSFPYWFFFEYLAPIVEAGGLIISLVLACLGLIHWSTFLISLSAILLFGFTYSVFAILFEVMTYNQYKKHSDIFKLILTAFLEPFLFHPFVVWSAIQGNIDLIRKKNSWGEMTRKGFANNTATQQVAEKTSPKQILQQLELATVEFVKNSLVWLLVILALSAFEFALNGVKHQFPSQMVAVCQQKLLNDLLFWLKSNCILYVLFIGTSFISLKASKLLFRTTVIILALVQLALIDYLTTTLSPLGADLYGYSLNDIRQTIGASGSVDITTMASFVIGALGVWFLFRLLSNAIKVNRFAAFAIPLLSAGFLLTSFSFDNSRFKSEYVNNLILNKSDFFFGESFNLFLSKSDVVEGNNNQSGFAYVDAQHYPFLHADSTADVLSPFFTVTEEKPNVVIILVEGLGRAFTNDGAYLGNFTPFLDSLAGKSLYWKNFLSTGGRTFAVLPSILGSLPFSEKGFLEMGEQMPSHLSLMSLLKLNGYQTSFYYGGDAEFDNMKLFLKKNAIDEIRDEATFPKTYTKLPENNGYTWGYGDKELFRYYLNSRKEQDAKPQLSVLLTVATHSPFLLNEQETYNKRFEQRMQELNFDEDKKKACRNYTEQYASILYADDAVRSFFEGYAKRADFKNTIFLITGDHRMPEIPMATKLDRFHVPLIVYSPMLNRSASFKSISTHFDIAPSLLAFLDKHYALKKPSLVSWVGDGLDTARQFRNRHAYPLMQTKNNVDDWVMGEYHLNRRSLFKVDGTMDEELVTDKKAGGQLEAAFNEFKARNQQLIEGAKLLPDSIYKKYYPRQ